MSVGRSDWSLIKPTFCFLFPPPFFQNINFFLNFVPPSKNKLQMQTQRQRWFLTTNKRQIRWLRIFSLGRWLQILHLVDTLLTPCWHLVDTLLVISSKCANVRMCNVQLWQHDISAMPFIHCHSQIFSCKVDNTFFPVAMTKYFPLTSLMRHGACWAFNINIDMLLKRCGTRTQLNKPFSHKYWW